MNAMKRAHEIRKSAAKKFNCKTSEIIFSLCLKMAWNEIKEGNMKGSEKQVAWAKDIKASTDKGFEAFKFRAKNAAANKIIDFIQSQEDARFWIEYRDYSAEMMLMSILKEGLRIKGFTFSENATATQDGKITITWEEIVPDGHGGYTATRTKTL